MKDTKEEESDKSTVTIHELGILIISQNYLGVL